MKDFFSIIGIKTTSLEKIQESTTSPEFIINLNKNNIFSKFGGFYVADPFVYEINDVEYLFCELLLKNGKGVIARVERRKNKKWNDPIIVLEESFHLSYPTIYNYKNGVYMLVESADDSKIRIYKANDISLKSWKFEKSLIKGKYYDPTIFEHRGNWFMFACSKKDFSQLELFYSTKDLLGPWKKHPESPFNMGSSKSRPAGPVMEWNSKKFRLAQDCSVKYGQAVKIFEIKKITKEHYREGKGKIILTNSNDGWNSQGMHHLQIYKHDKKNIYAVSDGYTKI